MARADLSEISRTGLDLASEVGKNLLMGLAPVRRWRSKRPRTSCGVTGTEGFLSTYAFQSLDLLREHVGDLRGKSVCEIGPGDHLTSGLGILAAGATHYGVIDRFPGDYTSERAMYWYKAIRDEWSRSYPDLIWPRSLDAAAFPASASESLELNCGPVESASVKRRYDILCSFQVAEHVSSIDAFATVHNDVLTPEGVGLHRVDMGPLGCWSAYRDPTTFLRFPAAFWKMTSSNRGGANRKRHHEFLKAFERAGLDAEVLLLEFFDTDVIEPQRWHKQFRAMPMDSVTVGTAIYKLRRRT